MHAKWDITSKCNLRCTHCSVADMYFNSGNVPRQLDRKGRLAVLDSLKDGGVSGLSLLGGEPLTLRGQLLDILHHATKIGLKLTIVSNGQLLDERTSRSLIDGGLDSLVVSIEAPVAEIHDGVRGKGTFRKLIHNLEAFLRIRGSSETPRVIVNTVLSGANRSVFADMIPFCIGLGVDEWTALSLMHVGNTLDNLDKMSISSETNTEVAIEIAKAMSKHGLGPENNSPKVNIQIIYPCVWEAITKQYGLWLPQPEICCPASSGLAYISPSGDAYVCDRVHSHGYVGAKMITEQLQPINLLETSFAEAWESAQFVEMFEFAKRSETYRDYEPCNRCKYLYSGVCNPCPLVATKGKSLRLEECLRAERILGDISAEADTPPTEWEEQHAFERLCIPPIEAGEFDRLRGREFRITRGTRHARQRDGSVLVMQPRATTPIKFNPVSWAVLERVDSGKCPQEVIDDFADAYLEIMEFKGIASPELQRSQLTEGYAAFIAHMIGLGVISEAA
ncbi:MAG TPA: radical SAM protein [Acetobacteraceae bacterium]|nr:radical SAM protein [Acetobacteraceae bacterium]